MEYCLSPTAFCSTPVKRKGCCKYYFKLATNLFVHRTSATCSIKPCWICLMLISDSNVTAHLFFDYYYNATFAIAIIAKFGIPDVFSSSKQDSISLFVCLMCFICSLQIRLDCRSNYLKKVTVCCLVLSRVLFSVTVSQQCQLAALCWA